jgi:uncharacterized DUF497 family protein
MEKKYEWDEKKRKSNLIKHGLDFADAWIVLESDEKITIEDAKHSQLEPRSLTIGYFKDYLCVAVIHTPRQEKIRIISFRRANKRERNYYGYQILHRRAIKEDAERNGL